MLDYGSGSGILGLAALKFGAAEVTSNRCTVRPSGRPRLGQGIHSCAGKEQLLSLSSEIVVVSLPYFYAKTKEQTKTERATVVVIVIIITVITIITDIINAVVVNVLVAIKHALTVTGLHASGSSGDI